MKKGLLPLVAVALTASATLPVSLVSATDLSSKGVGSSTINDDAKLHDMYTSVISHVEVHQPPKGWNPVTATAEELNYYNYPPRPTNKDQYEKWVQLVSTAKWYKPTFSEGKERRQSQPVGNYQQSTNWAGVISAQTNTEVTGYWVQQVAQSDSSHLPSWASEWIGLGGDGYNIPLIQEGTNSVANADASGDYNAWWEIVGTNMDTGHSVNITTKFPHSPGDQYYGDVWWTTDSSGYGTAHFYMQDQTTNAVFSFSQSGMTNYSGVTSSAEWILERPTVQSLSTYYLSKVNNVPFTCASGPVGNVSHPDPYASSTQYSRMYDSAGQNIAGETTIDYNGYFQATWLGYGNGH